MKTLPFIPSATHAYSLGYRLNAPEGCNWHYTRRPVIRATERGKILSFPKRMAGPARVFGGSTDGYGQ